MFSPLQSQSEAINRVPPLVGQVTSPPRPAPHQSSAAAVLHFVLAVLLVHALGAFWIPRAQNAVKERHGREVFVKIVVDGGKVFGFLHFAPSLLS